MGDEGVGADGGRICVLKGETLDFGGSVHSGLQVDAITYPSTTVVSASSLLVEWSTQTHNNLNFELRRRQSDDNLPFDYSKYLIMLVCIWVRLYRVYNA